MPRDDFATWKADATRERTSVDICLDRALLAQLNKAMEDLEGARSSPSGMMDSDDDIQAKMQTVVDLHEKVTEKTRTFVFEALLSHEWSELAAKYPPTKEQKKVNAQIDVDMERFPVAAAAACCVDPGLTEDDARWLADFLPTSEWMRIWKACLQVNVEGSSIPKSVSNIVGQLSSNLKSITSAQRESRYLSSGGE